jgi:hypothetical protein
MMMNRIDQVGSTTVNEVSNHNYFHHVVVKEKELDGLLNNTFSCWSYLPCIKNDSVS